jgi:flagellar basal-body rod protein FlgF
MENTLLVGLSRQMVLERELDVVANNMANVNTNGFKADHSLFEEYLNSGAREDNFQRPDRRVSYVQDRGTFRDFAQGPAQLTSNPLDVAIDGDGFLAVQTAGGERYTRDGNLHLNTQGQLVTVSGDPLLGTSGPIVFQPTDHDINIAPDGTVTVLEGSSRTDSVRGKLRVVNFADAQKLLKQGDNLFSADQDGAAAQPDPKSTIRQGYVEKSNVNAVAEMSRMVEIMRTYTQVANLLQQQSDLHKNAIDKLAEVPA